ncbi:MAG: hypothetical protein ACREU1_13105 [Burkholderiales bacterium]
MPALEDLGPWRAPDFARRPEGMVFDDWQPWQAWLKTLPAQRQLYAYNVRLSAGSPPAQILNPDDARLWQQLTDKRIDALGREAERFTIYEARRISGWSAIGQLLGYCELWPLNYPTLPLEACVLVTERIDDAIRAVALRQGLRVWVAGE